MDFRRTSAPPININSSSSSSSLTTKIIRSQSTVIDRNKEQNQCVILKVRPNYNCLYINNEEDSVLKLSSSIKILLEHKMYKYFIILIIIISLILATIDIKIKYMKLLIIWPIFVCIIFILEFQYMNMTICKNLLQTFNVWYMLMLSIIHTVTSWIHYCSNIQHSCDISEVYISIPLFLMGYICVLFIDAYVLRKDLNVIYFKRFITTLLWLNTVRWLTREVLWGRHKETESVSTCIFLCISAQEIRSSAMFQLSLFFARMMYVSIFYPNSLLLPQPRLNYEWEIKKNHSDVIDLEPTIGDLVLSINDTDENDKFISYQTLVSDAFELEWNLSEYSVLKITWLRRFFMKHKTTITILSGISIFTALIEFYVPIYGAFLLNIPVLLLFSGALTISHRRIVKRLFATFDWVYLSLFIMVWVIAVVIRNFSRDEANYVNANKGRYQSPLGIFMCCFGLILLDSMAVRNSIAKVCILFSVIVLSFGVLESAINKDKNVDVSFCHLWCTSTYSMEQNARIVFLVYTAKLAVYTFLKPNQSMFLTTRLIRIN